MRYSDEDLLEELHYLAEERGHPPTLQELREYGEISAMTYFERFGSWNEAMRAAGFKPREPESKIPKKDLIEELQQLAEELGEIPSASQMNTHGDYWASTYRRRLGSWNEALEQAGLDAENIANPISEEELIAELHRLRDYLDAPPTMSDMDGDGKFSSSTYVRQFGSWSAALEAGGFEATQSPSDVTDEDLIGEFHGLTKELGNPPSARDMDDHGSYASATYQRHFGTWSEAVEVALNQQDEDD